jgi:hypothetical protein
MPGQCDRASTQSRSQAQQTLASVFRGPCVVGGCKSGLSPSNRLTQLPVCLTEHLVCCDSSASKSTIYLGVSTAGYLDCSLLSTKFTFESKALTRDLPQLPSSWQPLLPPLRPLTPRSPAPWTYFSLLWPSLFRFPPPVCKPSLLERPPSHQRWPESQQPV